MIKYIKKDVTTITENCIIAHGVNCLGVMGSGIALAIKNKWPEVFTVYSNYLNSLQKKQLALGHVKFYTPVSGPIIANCFTQVNTASFKGERVADVDAIRLCLYRCAKLAEGHELDLYLPRIGCGLGGLSWENEVEPIVQQISKDFNYINIFVCDI